VRGAKEKLDPAIQYAEIARAIARAESITGHRLYFSICNWGVNSPWTWAPNIGGVAADIWRTSGDIVAPSSPIARTADAWPAFPECFRTSIRASIPKRSTPAFTTIPT